MTPFLLGWLRDESGATAIEYGLLLGMIALVIVGTVTQLGSDLNTSLLSKAATVTK
jgi:pilus assembly protein Flp/PilA